MLAQQGWIQVGYKFVILIDDKDVPVPVYTCGVL